MKEVRAAQIKLGCQILFKKKEIVALQRLKKM